MNTMKDEMYIDINQDGRQKHEDEETVVELEFLKTFLCDMQGLNDTDCKEWLSSVPVYHDYDPWESWLFPENIAVPIVFGVTLLAGLIGNGLVVYVVFKHGAMKTVSNLYFVNLAIADMLFLLVCVPFTAITYVLPYWPFGSVTCKAVNYTMMVAMATSVMTLTAMGIDRYQAVIRPVECRANRTVHRTSVLLASVWVFNLVTATPMFFITRVHEMWDHGELRNFCIEYFTTNSFRQAYTLTMFLLYYVTPLSIIAVCYFCMARNLKANTGLSNARSPRRRKVAKIVLVVVATFALCWLPIHVVHLHTDFGISTLSDVLYIVKIIAHVMSFVNSTINPLIYSFMSEAFRESFWETCNCCRCHQPQVRGLAPNGGIKKQSISSSGTPPKREVIPLAPPLVDGTNDTRKVEYKHTVVSNQGLGENGAASVVMTTVIQLETFNVTDNSQPHRDAASL